MWIFLPGRKIGRMEREIHPLVPPDIISLFGEDHPPVIGMGKMGEEKKVLGYVIFGLKEGFEAYKFVFEYNDRQYDMHQLLFPKAKIELILKNPIN